MSLAAANAWAQTTLSETNAPAAATEIADSAIAASIATELQLLNDTRSQLHLHGRLLVVLLLVFLTVQAFGPACQVLGLTTGTLSKHDYSRLAYAQANRFAIGCFTIFDKDHQTVEVEIYTNVFDDSDADNILLNSSIRLVDHCECRPGIGSRPAE